MVKQKQKLDIALININYFLFHIKKKRDKKKFFFFLIILIQKLIFKLYNINLFIIFIYNFFLNINLSIANLKIKKDNQFYK
jgi:hypothetical protein